MQTLPATIPQRIETGALKIGSDWPGVFIRGDEAVALAQLIHFVNKTANLESMREFEKLLLSAFGPK